MAFNDPQESARRRAQQILPRPSGPGRRTGYGQAPGQSPYRRRPGQGKPRSLPRQASPRARPPGIYGRDRLAYPFPSPTPLPPYYNPQPIPDEVRPGRDSLSPYLDLTRQFLRPPVRPPTPSVPRYGSPLPDPARRSLLRRILGGQG